VSGAIAHAALVGSEKDACGRPLANMRSQPSAAAKAAERAGVVILYETIDWQPVESGHLQSIRIRGSQAHPARFVHSAAMASAACPSRPTSRLRRTMLAMPSAPPRPASRRRQGPSGRRHSTWQLAQGPPRGPLGHAKSGKLIENADRGWAALEQERLQQVTPLSRFRQGTPIHPDEGVLFTTYATVLCPRRKGFARSPDCGLVGR
jgi:hypothetical protein